MKVDGRLYGHQEVVVCPNVDSSDFHLVLPGAGAPQGGVLSPGRVQTRLTLVLGEGPQERPHIVPVTRPETQLCFTQYEDTAELLLSLKALDVCMYVVSRAYREFTC